MKTRLSSRFLSIPFLVFLSINESIGFQFLHIASNLEHDHHLSRRSFARSVGISGLVSACTTLIQTDPAHAMWFEAKERRQLELCVVNVLRVQYWAELQSSNLEQAAVAGDEVRRKELYLESRLAAKALVTGKLGGGATNQVYTLAGLKLRECLEDLVFYSSSSRALSGLSEDLIESLASLVEFDGLETTQDPSPRSMLMLSMYNKDKETFVRRMLRERIIQTTKAIISSVDPNVRRRCEAYVLTTYPQEVPKTHTASLAADNNVA